MDTKTLILAAGVFGGGFAASAVVAFLMEPHTHIEVRPLTPTMEPTFHKVAEGEVSEAEAEAARLSADQLMENMRTGNVPDSAISEGADDAPPVEGHYFHTTLTQYGGIDKWRPAQPTMRVACFSGRQGKASVHFIVHFDGAHMMAHDATLNEWVFGGCSDSLHIGYATGATHELTANQYWQTRLSMVPLTPEFASVRTELTGQVGATKPKGLFGG